MAGFLSPLELEYVDGRHWVITKEFDYHVDVPDSGRIIHIHAGFITDFASIPRVLWPVLPPTGSYGKAAVIHDYLYQTCVINLPNGFEIVDRGQADHILLEAMEVLGTSRAVRETIYWGVRAGGWWAWRKHRKEDKEGRPHMDDVGKL